MTKYAFADLDKWVAKVEARADAVIKDAAQEVVKVMQTPKGKGGRTPIDTGAMVRSLSSSLNGGGGVKGADSYVMVAGSMKAGDTATFAYTVDYAKYVNDGARGRAGDHFVEGAVDQWPQIVKASTAKAKASIK